MSPELMRGIADAVDEANAEAFPPHTPSEDLRKAFEEQAEWKDSYKGKLWSTAVQKCFEAPFVEVAIQHLLFTIDKKHQKELVEREALVREELREKLPEEKIIHSYMKTQLDMHSTEYCEGWNDYRMVLISLLQ